MRGAAWPLSIFATLLVASGVMNRIWENSDIMSATFAFAAASIYAVVAVLLARGGSEPLRRGGALPDLTVRAVPAASLGAATLGLGTGTLAAGFVFGTSLVIAACLIMAAGIGLLTRELRAQHGALVRERER